MIDYVNITKNSGKKCSITYNKMKIAGLESDGKMIECIMKPSDAPTLIPQCVSKHSLNQPSKSVFSDSHLYPDKNTTVYAFTDTNATNKPQKTFEPPNVIRLKNLNFEKVKKVSASGTGIYAVTQDNRILTSDTNIEETNDPDTMFSPPYLLRDATAYTVSCGLNHQIIICDKNGQHSVYSAGSNSMGECGMGDGDFLDDFLPIEIPEEIQFVQVACGSNFTLLLNSENEVLAFGSNKHGQLGLGPYGLEVVKHMTLVKGLYGLPIVAVAAGLGHSFALTSTGALYASGRNDKGQLGTTSSQKTDSFTLVDTLSDVHIISITACGSNSAALDEFGNIYVWGEYWGATPQLLQICDEGFVEVALGYDGRLAAVSKLGHLYISGYFNSSGEQVKQPIRIVSTGDPFARVFSGGNFFIAIAGSKQPNPLNVADVPTMLPPDKPIIKGLMRPPATTIILNSAHFPRFVALKDAANIISHVFGNLSTINGCFISDKFSESHASIKCGLDVDACADAFDQFAAGVNSGIMESLDNMFTLVLNDVIKNPLPIQKPATMRFLMTALLHPSVNSVRTSAARSFWNAATTAIIELKAQQLLTQWITQLPRRHIKRIKDSLMDLFEDTLRRLGTYNAKREVDVLEIVYFASTRTQALSFEDFYSRELNRRIEVKAEVDLYESPGEWCFTKRAPWLLNANTKTHFVRMKSSLAQIKLQTSMVQQARRTTNAEIPIEQLYLVLKVSRDDIANSSISQLRKLPNPDTDLKKPLRVVFEGEPGVDEGGVQREFFELIVRELFADEEMWSRTRDFFWFKMGARSKLLMRYMFVGQLFGLAIYNGKFLSVRFPTALYKKLRGLAVNFQDLEEFDPELADSLKKLLAYDGDVENDMCLTWEYMDREICPGGRDIPVTRENREEYVDRLVDFIFNESIRDQFDSFRTGFMTAAGAVVLDLFRPEELALLVGGREDLDFHALEGNTEYEGYTPDAPAVKLFWNIVHNKLTLEEKKKLLLFTTSSPRAPIGGLGTVPFKIMRDADPNHIPTSHTCFFMLVLPDTTDEEEMLKKLRIALDNSEGFQFK